MKRVKKTVDDEHPSTENHMTLWHFLTRLSDVYATEFNLPGLINIEDNIYAYLLLPHLRCCVTSELSFTATKMMRQIIELVGQHSWSKLFDYLSGLSEMRRNVQSKTCTTTSCFPPVVVLFIMATDKVLGFVSIKCTRQEPLLRKDGSMPPIEELMMTTELDLETFKLLISHRETVDLSLLDSDRPVFSLTQLKEQWK